jgi:hypothetical protein
MPVNKKDNKDKIYKIRYSDQDVKHHGSKENLFKALRDCRDNPKSK